ncbi:Manganese transport system ATP-binding protein MntB [Candidatus Rhabdochlamydia oedothoracis]|uniref:Manganese transport system ATP-binding protein MntB n=1 Tax=Candidatus Rhabdochlamydia oedothoracis TaxID=2720720 RepID=A0ABX8V207_9BACT|nr:MULTISPECIES: metal ABC transporter ATP-binding protein [Rhabdochlamydia]KAG6559326.1 High-affinity zinc uptake system ATP-binding protein ZnuC [Candidatus Rhabdochlamydia sp. W815]MCL6756110.1 metal ABC transporter ATP-binding protein [Candidatus Rhabdochlamydia oedothoracis]QYF49181.1 Manganese transport system ATP-binding protein MntB [Candidatus Rhabdochlamydia oedothoracis]
MQNAIEVENITVTYGKIAVLWDINLTIPKGKLVGIIGPNGAGKSTLLKAMLEMVDVLSGTITFLDQPFKKSRKKIAYVPQRSSVDWDFPITAFELVLMGRYNKIGYLKWPKAADREATKKALGLVGMLSFANRQISQLSGGQQQRLFIARALMQEAEFYLMDEPFAGVDIATEKAIVVLMNKLREQGKTLLVVHHDLSTVKTYFDWVILLNTCLIANGPVQEVFCSDMIMRTFGRSHVLLDEAAHLTQNKTTGIS